MSVTSGVMRLRSEVSSHGCGPNSLLKADREGVEWFRPLNKASNRRHRRDGPLPVQLAGVSGSDRIGLHSETTENRSGSIRVEQAPEAEPGHAVPRLGFGNRQRLDPDLPLADSLLVCLRRMVVPYLHQVVRRERLMDDAPPFGIQLL
jgi:hypothetical protein